MNQDVIDQLPNGCVLRDLGDYYTKDGEKVPVLLIRCAGKDVTSTMLQHSEMAGKATVHKTALLIKF